MSWNVSRGLVVALSLGFPSAAWSQDLRASLEAYQHAEAQRRVAVGAQINLNEALRYGLYWPTPYGETIYYPRSVYGYPTAGYVDVYSRRGLSGGYRSDVYFGAAPLYGGYYYSAYPSLYLGATGVAFPPPVRQPIGQRQEQTGPNRWESYPVYGDEPPPAVESPPAAAPPVPRIEPKPRRSGPREF